MSAPRHTFDGYRGIEAVNWSRLKYMRDSPLAYRYHRDHGVTVTDAMRLGSATHTAILEPHRFLADYVLWDGGDGRGKEWAAFRESAGERTILTSSQYTQALAISDAVRNNAQAMRYLDHGTNEATVKWTDAASGLVCKGRMDLYTGPVIVDVKTTRSIDERKLRSQMETLGVFCQLAMYRMGVIANEWAVDPRCVIIAAEQFPPHDVGVFCVHPPDIETAEGEVAALLGKLRDCMNRDHWPGRFESETPIARPAWAMGGDITFSDEE